MQRKAFKQAGQGSDAFADIQFNKVTQWTNEKVR